MISIILRNALDQILANPELAKEWAGKGVEWVRRQREQRAADEAELKSLRDRVNRTDHELMMMERRAGANTEEAFRVAAARRILSGKG